MRFTRFDYTVWATLATLSLALAILVWRGDTVGVGVLRALPEAGSAAGATAPVVIEFAQRMDTQSAEAHFEIDPPVQGRFVWRENSLYFLPSEAWQVGETYTVSVRAGAESQLGHQVLEDLNWSFTVREPGYAYLHESSGGFELWGSLSLDEPAGALSHSGGRIFDYTVSADGNELVYSVVNDENGIDLWIVQRDGADERLLHDCGADRCYAADWSPDGQIAYNRASAPLTPTDPYSPPRVWLLDPLTGETLRLHADTQKIGYGPSWSPDAARLAYYDGIQSRIVILDVRTGDEVYLPSRAGVVGSWSADGAQMLFYDTQPLEGGVVNLIYRADLQTQDILPFFDPQPTDANYSDPTVSPDDAWVAVKVKPFDTEPGDQVWVMPADGRFGNVVSEEPGFLFTSVKWDPASKRLLLSRLQLGGADRAPQVWLWDKETAQLTLLAEEASSAAWLP